MDFDVQWVEERKQELGKFPDCLANGKLLLKCIFSNMFPTKFTVNKLNCLNEFVFIGKIHSKWCVFLKFF